MNFNLANERLFINEKEVASLTYIGAEGQEVQKTPEEVIAVTALTNEHLFVEFKEKGIKQITEVKYYNGGVVNSHFAAFSDQFIVKGDGRIQCRRIPFTNQFTEEDIDQENMESLARKVDNCHEMYGELHNMLIGGDGEPALHDWLQELDEQITELTDAAEGNEEFLQQRHMRLRNRVEEIGNMVDAIQETKKTLVEGAQIFSTAVTKNFDIVDENFAALWKKNKELDNWIEKIQAQPIYTPYSYRRERTDWYMVIVKGMLLVVLTIQFVEYLRASPAARRLYEKLKN
jgi:hypothetical protein